VRVLDQKIAHGDLREPADAQDLIDVQIGEDLTGGLLGGAALVGLIGLGLLGN
jgi:hypothetical protein